MDNMYIRGQIADDYFLKPIPGMRTAKRFSCTVARTVSAAAVQGGFDMKKRLINGLIFALLVVVASTIVVLGEKNISMADEARAVRLTAVTGSRVFNGMVNDPDYSLGKSYPLPWRKVELAQYQYRHKRKHQALELSENPPFLPVLDQADTKAQFNLALRYYKGDGVPQDKQKAAEWFQKAAEQGHANAQGQLGVMYAKGEGVPQDMKNAAEWFQKAAEQGIASAQFNLGIMYENGKGVEQNKATAKEWYGKACAKGVEKACKALKRIEQ